MKNLFCSLIALTFLAQPAMALSKTKLRKIQHQMTDQLLDLNLPGFSGTGITVCSPFALALAAGLAVPAVMVPPEQGVAVYFETDEDMESFAKKAVNDELGLPQVNICPLVSGRIVAQ